MLNATIHNPRHNPKVEDFVFEHLELALEKFADRISRLEVSLLDENAGKGGEDKVCTIDVKLGRMGQFHVRAKTDNVYASVVRAIHKADALIGKTLDRNSAKSRVRHHHGGVSNTTVELVEQAAQVDS